MKWLQMMPHSTKEAIRVYRRGWYANLPASRKQKMLDAAKVRATELRRYLDEVKVSRGCTDCGYNKHPAALDFDHVRGEKSILVSFCKSKAQAVKEIEKCEVRCACCHRIKTWERKREALK